MSKKIGLIIAFFIFFHGLASAKPDFKTCSQNGLVLLYVNGVWNKGNGQRDVNALNAHPPFQARPV